MTGFWKTVPNHTFIFHYIYYCHMKSITFSIIFHSTTWNSMLKLLKDCKKYSVNTYASVEISLNTCRNTLDFMCDLELFSKIRSQILKCSYRREKRDMSLLSDFSLFSFRFRLRTAKKRKWPWIFLDCNWI